MIPLFYFSFLSKTNLGFVNGFITLGLGNIFNLHFLYQTNCRVVIKIIKSSYSG